MIIITKAKESKSKKQFQHGVRIASSLRQLRENGIRVFLFLFSLCVLQPRGSHRKVEEREP